MGSQRALIVKSNLEGVSSYALYIAVELEILKRPAFQIH